MSTPTFVVATRDKDGQAKLFRITHEEAHDHEQVMALVRAEMPDSAAILVGVS